jgi:hypothetical protein
MPPDSPHYITPVERNRKMIIDDTVPLAKVPAASTLIAFKLPK